MKGPDQKVQQKKHILILVENLPVPFDRRVWQEATSLVQKGYRVSVICPKTPGYDQSYEFLEGVDIYRHFLPFQGNGMAGFILEYSSALISQFFLSIKIYWRCRFDVIQACNPPDLLFLVAAPFKLLGVRFVFDHHDAFPELFQVKFPQRTLLYRITRFAEWLTFLGRRHPARDDRDCRAWREAAPPRAPLKADQPSRLFRTWRRILRSQ